jgi:hypothetical protein
VARQLGEEGMVIGRALVVHAVDPQGE